MDRDPADKNLLYLMLGHQVFIEYLAGPRVTEDNFDQVVKQGETLAGPEARTRAYYLRGISSQGIEVTPTEEHKNYVFISWGAVLRIWGPDRLELEYAEREAMEQNQQHDTEDTAPQPDRQEAMDLLANAETLSEAAAAKVAADCWLLIHPSDGDVRMAREQLEDRFPDDTDPEEASLT